MRKTKMPDGPIWREAWIYDDEQGRTWFYMWAEPHRVGVLLRRFCWCIGLAALFAVMAFLFGCQHTVPKWDGYRLYVPPVLINGYDPTLASHAEALGLKEPRKP